MIVHQLDELKEPANGPVQQELNKITGTLTCPQVFVGGKFMGQGKEMEDLKGAGKLKSTLEEAGASFGGR